MKNDHSCQAGNGAKPASATDGNATGFTRMRSKLAFDRLVEMGARMGMENPLFLCHERAAKATTLINGREYLNFSTYDYLDINAHPEITEAVTKAAALYGTSAGASRLVGGERPPHRELERALAELYGVEDCIVYVSGHATNVSTLGFLFGHRDAIFHDGLAHNDCDALEELLRNKRAEHKRAIIVTEGLFSMDGNIPDLPRIIALKKKYDCMLLVDEAHSLGVRGATGRGAREYFNIDPTDVDMWMSTLSKSMCGCGGFIAGSHELVEFLKYGSPLERVRNLQRISQFFIRYAAEIGLDTGAAQGYAVVPVMVGDPMVAGFLSNALFKRGVYVMPITFPAVKEGTDRLRFFLSAAHTEDHIRRALDAVREAMPEARAIVDEYKRTHADAAEGD